MRELKVAEVEAVSGGVADFSRVTARVYSTAQIVDVGGGGGFNWYDFAETVRMANEFFRD